MHTYTHHTTFFLPFLSLHAQANTHVNTHVPRTGATAHKTLSFLSSTRKTATALLSTRGGGGGGGNGKGLLDGGGEGLLDGGGEGLLGWRRRGAAWMTV